VEAVFPGCMIVQNRVDAYPITVTVSGRLAEQERSGEDDQNKPTVIIWTGRQQDLFRKYASKRKQAMEKMRKNLLDFKKGLSAN
jgi:hypothetical protein